MDDQAAIYFGKNPKYGNVDVYKASTFGKQFQDEIDNHDPDHQAKMDLEKYHPINVIKRMREEHFGMTYSEEERVEQKGLERDFVDSGLKEFFENAGRLPIDEDEPKTIMGMKRPEFWADEEGLFIPLPEQMQQKTEKNRNDKKT